MKIEGNQKELDAMAEFHKGNRTEGLRLQEEFASVCSVSSDSSFNFLLISGRMQLGTCSW